MLRWDNVTRDAQLLVVPVVGPEGFHMARTKERGFAAMDSERRREIARKGGRVAHERGTAHEFTPDEARAAGRKGGQSISRNRAYMSAIGRKGGEAVSRDRSHMAAIGREGGLSYADDAAADPAADGRNTTPAPETLLTDYIAAADNYAP